MKAFYLLIPLLLPCTIFAQPAEKNKEVEQIIITKKATDDKKLNITVDGDKVTVNGEPGNSANNSTITVIRRKIKDQDVFRDPDSSRINNIIVRRQIALSQPMNKAMLGVSTQKTDQGVEIINATDESAAQKAGLKEGDIITEVDRNKIEAPDDLSKAIKDKNPGDKVTVVYLRNKKQYTAVAELTRWKTPETAWNYEIAPDVNFDLENMMSRSPRIVQGFRFPQNRNDEVIVVGQASMRPKMGVKIQDLEEGAGVKVIDVQKGSDADKAGIKEGDIIKELNGTTITGTDLMSSLVRANRTNSPIKLKIDRNGKIQNIEVIVSKKIKTADL